MPESDEGIQPNPMEPSQTEPNPMRRRTSYSRGKRAEYLPSAQTHTPYSRGNPAECNGPTPTTRRDTYTTGIAPYNPGSPAVL